MTIQLNSCCMCCSLDTGTKIIACLQMILGIAKAITIGVESKHMDHEQKRAYAIGMIINDVITILLGMMLLIGVTKRRQSLVLTWIIIFFLSLILSGVFLIIAIAMAGGGLAIVISELIPFFIYIYFLLVVYSYYKQEKTTIDIP